MDEAECNLSEAGHTPLQVDRSCSESAAQDSLNASS